MVGNLYAIFNRVSMCLNWLAWFIPKEVDVLPEQKPANLALKSRWHDMTRSWVVPPPSNSHHQDYYIFSRGSQPKPSFATGILGGGTTQDLDLRFAPPQNTRIPSLGGKES